LFQGAGAQPAGQLRVLAFPGQLRLGEGPGAPQRLAGDQEVVERLEAGKKVGAGEHDESGEASPSGEGLGKGQRPWQASTRSQRSSSLKPCTSTKAMIR